MAEEGGLGPGAPFVGRKLRYPDRELGAKFSVLMIDGLMESRVDRSRSLFYDVYETHARCFEPARGWTVALGPEFDQVSPGFR